MLFLYTLLSLMLGSVVHGCMHELLPTCTALLHILFLYALLSLMLGSVVRGAC